jgi:hypothetical protein
MPGKWVGGRGSLACPTRGQLIEAYVHDDAVVHADEYSSVFPLVHQEIFPRLFDHFIKGFDQFSKPIWSVYQEKTCFPPICLVYHLVSSAVPRFPNLFLQLIITVFLQFSKIFPTYWCMLSLGFISFPTDFLSSSWCFIGFGCPFLHCIIRFHQFSSPKSSLYRSFSSDFSHLRVFYH